MKELIEQLLELIVNLDEERQKVYKELIRQLILEARKDGLLK